MATLPAPKQQSPAGSPVVFLVAFFVVLLLASALYNDRAATTPGGGEGAFSRIHPLVIEKVLQLADKAGALSDGHVREVDISRALDGVDGVAVVTNLGHVSGEPRVVQYNIFSFGSWVRVCVNVPKDPATRPYAVVCPTPYPSP